MSRKSIPSAGPGSRVTMHQIAKAAQVSLGTVSHVINDTAPVRPELKQRVLDAIAALGYRPNQLSRGLRLNRTSLIGMIIPDITNPFFPAVVRGVEDLAFKSSFRLMLCNADNDCDKEAAYLNDLRSFLPAGILVIPSLNSSVSNDDPFPPIVCVDGPPHGWTGDSVTVDNLTGGATAARYLLEMGHRHIGILSGLTNIVVFRDRLDGFVNTMATAGAPVQPRYIEEALYDHASGYTSALRLLALTPRPTAIFASTDLMAAGALSAIRSLGLSCPEDLSVLSFDGLDLSEMTYPTLTSIVQPGYELGRVAAQLLLDRIGGLDTPAREITLPTELKIRGSVARLQTA